MYYAILSGRNTGILEILEILVVIWNSRALRYLKNCTREALEVQDNKVQERELRIPPFGVRRLLAVLEIREYETQAK